MAILLGSHDTWNELVEPKYSDATKPNDLETHTWQRPRSDSISSACSECPKASTSKGSQFLGGIRTKLAHLSDSPFIKNIVSTHSHVSRKWNRLFSKSPLHGWRMGLLFNILISLTILACNTAILLLGGFRNGGYKSGLGILMSGDAADMSWWTSAFHVGINAMSTLLLAASNYTMQVLGSPTREEVDRAHSKSGWMDVGVLSTRNLRRIPKGRLAVCLIMGVSSLPIHLFYNSAVFFVAATNEYHVHLLTDGSPEHKGVRDMSNAPTSVVRDSPQYELVEPSEWPKHHLHKDGTMRADIGYGDLYLILHGYASQAWEVSESGPDGDLGQTSARWNPQKVEWNSQGRLPMTLPFLNGCAAKLGCEYDNATGIPGDWLHLRSLISPGAPSNPSIPKYAHISAAFSKLVGSTRKSRVQLSLTFMIIVVVCNTVKLCTMVYVLLIEKSDFLVTIGDCASSFLEHSDSITERMCVMSRDDIIDAVHDGSHRNSNPQDRLDILIQRSNRSWTQKSTKLSSALDKDRQLGSSFIFIVTGLLFIALIATLSLLGGRFDPYWGASSRNTFRSSDLSVASSLINAWLANAPQIILSFCYLAINSECTAMAGAREWNSFALLRKGLRVTRPLGQQRDTYFLQLPYRWSLPLMIASGGLHWLLSQSFFIVRMDTYSREGRLVETQGKSRSAVGFSGTSFIALVLGFYILVGVVGVVGRRKVRLRIPAAQSCSLVISAACHPGPEDMDAQLRPVRWGVVEERMYRGERHCTLSSRKVRNPKVGEIYL